LAPTECEEELLVERILFAGVEILLEEKDFVVAAKVLGADTALDPIVLASNLEFCEIAGEELKALGVILHFLNRNIARHVRTVIALRRLT
jgi:hypothetical protein